MTRAPDATGEPAARDRLDAALPADDVLIVFRTVRSGVRGAVVRLGAPLDTIVRRHDVPDLARAALAEAVLLAALAGSALRDAGTLIVQTKTSGVVPMLAADYAAPGKLRGTVRATADAPAGPAAPDAARDVPSVLGPGHLAITLDLGPERERQQSVIGLDGAPLAHAAATYFTEREGLATFIELVAHAPEAAGGADASWRAGGLLVQSLARAADMAEGSEALEHWTRVATLAATVEAAELTERTLPLETLLLRLFHEEGVVVERVQPLAATCRCSREKVLNVLRSFGAQQVQDLRDDDGKVSATCEFCTTRYAFDLAEIDAAGP